MYTAFKLNMASDSEPNRQFMEESDIKWRNGKPNFDKADVTFNSGRTRHHEEGSLARIVEDLVKTFEMEASHKIDPKQWKTVHPEKFCLRVNGGKPITAADIAAKGTYTCFLADHPFYTGKDTSFEESHTMFKDCFTDGFPWELLEIYGEPPTVTFTWRHWAKFSGPYLGHEPTGETMEIFGSTTATVDDQLRMMDVQMYFDSTPLLANLNHVKCPMAFK